MAEGGNKAAGTRARQIMQDIKNAAQTVRKKILQRFADKILAAKEELALLETLDMGKPIQYSLSVDVPSTARCIAWYAEAVDKIYDEIAPTGDKALALITREAMGVIGVIVPWNYPMIMAAWKLGPALAAGNSVVLKPSEKSPLTACRLAELAVEAGIPHPARSVRQTTATTASSPCSRTPLAALHSRLLGPTVTLSAAPPPT